jgi:uncharacterized protein (TIGR00106 family)
MSVLVEFAMFPTDKKGESASPLVSKVIEMIRDSGVPYKLASMGTSFETNTIEEANALIAKAYYTLDPYSDRVYTIIKMDIRKGASHRLEGKIESVKKHIGEVNA